MNKAENRLPVNILSKSLRRSNEFGWKEDDFIEAVNAAREIPMATIGGQVMYILPEGVCELYWLSYDPEDRKLTEDWLTYCNRTANECIEKFTALIASTDINAAALENFTFLEEKRKAGVNIERYKAFVLYFDDTESMRDF